MTNLSDLPRDLLEEILSKVPVISLRTTRSTCKNWNNLSKGRSFTKKHLGEAKVAAAKVVMVMNFRVYLMSVNLNGIHKGVEPSINRQGKLISLDDANQVDISKVYHCDGLLLCSTKDYTRLVVWNPYLGQTRWIQPRNSYTKWDRYALGYKKKKNNSLRSHKILRFVDYYDRSGNHRICELEIYNFKTNSWKVVDVNPNWNIQLYARGVSLKGNTYWFAQKRVEGLITGWIPDYLICFDFTRERFGPRRPLPFFTYVKDIVTLSLSSVRDEQLALLFQRWDTLQMEIWVTTKIEPKVSSWSKLFLAVNMKPLADFQFPVMYGSFFIDEEKKVVVVFDKDKDTVNPTRNIAYVIGKDGYVKQVDLGESTDKHCFPLVCSYVPSSMRIKHGGKRKRS